MMYKYNVQLYIPGFGRQTNILMAHFYSEKCVKPGKGYLWMEFNEKLWCFIKTLVMVAWR